MTATPLVELTVIEQSGVEVLVLDAPGAQVAVGPEISTATPQPLGTAAAGTTGQAADAGHIHAHGNLAGSSLHALASTSAAGFMSAAQFDLLAAATDQDAAGTLVRRDESGDFEANIITAALDGNAATATKLATARTINGQSFDGTGNITITADPNSHTHGNISDDGKIGSTAGLPIVTGAAGVLQAGSFGATAGTFAAGDDARFSEPRDPNVGSVTNDSVANDAAIALSKLATGALPTAITVASANIVDDTIVNADVNASAAIAGTKIAPDFGSQNLVTTGTITGGSLSPTGTAVPVTGVFRPATNVLAGATNTLERFRVTPGGAFLVGATTEPLGQISGTIVAQSKSIIGAANHGIFQQYAASSSTNITASTGTIVFKFKTESPTIQRSVLIRIAVCHVASSNTPADYPAAEYTFRIFNTSAGVCDQAGLTTIMEYQYVRATHYAFADLGSGECTVTLTNPTAQTLSITHYAVTMLTGGAWFLDSVTLA